MTHFETSGLFAFSKKSVLNYFYMKKALLSLLTIIAVSLLVSVTQAAQCTLVGGTDFSLCNAITKDNCGLAAKGDFMKCKAVTAKNCGLAGQDYFLTCKAMLDQNCGLVKDSAFNLCLAVTKK